MSEKRKEKEKEKIKIKIKTKTKTPQRHQSRGKVREAPPLPAPITSEESLSGPHFAVVDLSES
jgi:hypothetical protein